MITTLGKNFSVVHYNIQSLNNKLELITNELQNFDVIGLTETWLDGRVSDNDISMNGYTLYRRDRRGDNHGGICVYAKSTIYSKRRTDLELLDLECIWLELHCNHRKMLVGTFYRPPNSPSATLTSIETSIGLAFDTTINDILIVGDFNFDILKTNSSKKIQDICQHFNLQQLINTPTHFTEQSNSIIDLILTSNKNHILLSGVGDPFLEQNLRYHCPIYCAFNFHTTTSTVFTRHIWLYDRGDYDSLSQAALNTNWELLKHNDINIYASNITDHLMDLAGQYIPNRKVKVKQSDPPWLNSRIKKLIRKRKRLYDKFKRTNKSADFETYKQFRNRVTYELRKSKQYENEKLAGKLKNDTLGPKDWWKTLKTVIKPMQDSSIPPLHINGETYTENRDKSKIFNDFFSDQTKLDESNASLPNSNCISNNVLESIQTNPQEVESMLKSLKIGKAAGPDSVNNRLLQKLAYPLSFPLCDLYNFSFSSGTVPDLWKKANVIPVFKKNDPSDPSNYRPISLLSAVGKVMEKIVHKYVFNFFRDNAVITSLQSGFIPGDSTVNQLADIYNTFCKALDDGKEVRAIFCDISKAFDRVWHNGLIHKLRNVGIVGTLLNWFTDYLSNRKQRVVLPGAASDWTQIYAGVPQGSVLGPLLFLIYIHDIVENINACIRLFADDTSLYLIVENPIEAAEKLNSDLAKVHAWASKWLVTFNPSKTESLIFSRKLNKPYHPPVYMSEQPITEVSSHKHLGLVFQQDCTWHEHIDNIKCKAWFRINIMRKLKFTLDRKSLQTIYFSFIRPLLEYANIVWDNCTQYEVNELEKIQHEAARIVTGATKLASINSLLTETGWETLATRRKKHKLVSFYKMQNGLSPVYLSTLLPDSVGNTSSYNLRNINNTQTIHCNTQQYYNSFLPATIRNWNELSQEIRDSNTLTTFKQKLNANIRGVPKFYNIGKRNEQVYQTRLRTSCSTLNQHLFSRNIIAHPNCICGAIEDTNHFLLECNLFQNLRQEMITTVSEIAPPTLNTLLFGNPNLRNEANELIFLAVQSFISKTKRLQAH